jgi:Ca-activated chloride channel family protein
MNTMRVRLFAQVAVVIAIHSLLASARGQGIIVDRRPRVPIAHTYEVREVAIDARIRDQIAEVHVSQTFHNPGSFELEAEFLFPLPEDGAIQNFVLMVDGRELPGRLLPRDEARRIFEEIVRTKRDPALLEYMGRGLYRTSVFPIPPGADRKVTMRYTRLCHRDRDVVEFSYPLSTQKFTAKPIERLLVTLSLQSKEAIKSVYCPSDLARIDRTGDHDVRVTLERRDVVPSQDFRLVFTLADGSLAASVLSFRPSATEDGFFLLLASPEVKPVESRPQSKTVIFAIDRSGSMAGKKIEQARGAVKAVLNNLRDGDLFNIVVYDDRAESFRPELMRYGAAIRDEAVRFVDNIREGGSTNIDSALKTALAMVQDESRPSYVLFLTDGLPTAGETLELPIADNCRAANVHHARVFCFGVGYDVNARLLDRVSGGNGGTSEYVKPDEDIESHVARFYAKMTSPVLADIRIELPGIDVNRAFPRAVPDLFDGGQIVWAGRYRQGGKTTIRLSGKVGTERRNLEFPAELADVSGGSSFDFVERLWVVRRLGDLIDQIDLKGQNKELVDELVALSTKYGILTPNTSFLADERVPLHLRAENASHSRRALESLAEVQGQLGVDQRGYKQALMQADRAQDAEVPVPRLARSEPRNLPVGGGESLAMALLAGKPTQSIKGAPGTPFGLSQNQPGPAGMMGGMGLTGGARGGFVPGSAAVGLAPATEPELSKVAGKVRQIGAKTFYWKNNRWVDSSVLPGEDAAATVVTQLTDAYFELARSQKAGDNQYLSQAEPVTVKLNGKVYHVQAAAADATR